MVLADFCVLVVLYCFRFGFLLYVCVALFWNKVVVIWSLFWCELLCVVIAVDWFGVYMLACHFLGCLLDWLGFSFGVFADCLFWCFLLFGCFVLVCYFGGFLF